MFRYLHQPHFYKSANSVIVFIPKPWKMPKENYLEPAEWLLKFPPPSQIRPRAFVDCTAKTKLGPSDEVDKEKIYKTPEYYSYHPYTFYNVEEDLNCKRCRPQPSPWRKVSSHSSTDKCP